MRLIICCSIFMFLFSCQTGKIIVSVSEEIFPSQMGRTLAHEHILVDFIGADLTGYHRWQRDSVISRTLPYLLEARKLGYQTLVDCTPAYLGRDPWLLKELAARSGLQIITNTGYYGARNNTFLPKHAFAETAEELAGRWIEEFESGIEGSGVRPGFIKISIDPGAPLSPVHEKIVRAAAITHRKTGLPIASHTGPAAGAFAQLDILADEKVSPNAWIWVHAQNAASEDHLRAAEMGAWISLDNVSGRPESLSQYVENITALKNAGFLPQVLISHDAGWYRPGEPHGGEFRGFTDIDQFLIPALMEKGFTRTDIKQLLVDNPAAAFYLRKKN